MPGREAQQRLEQRHPVGDGGRVIRHARLPGGEVRRHGVPVPPPVPACLVDQHPPHVGVRVLCPLDPVPVPEGLGQRLLDQVVGQVPVTAQQVGHPVQRRGPALDELQERLVRRPRHVGLLSVMPGSTHARREGLSGTDRWRPPAPGPRLVLTVALSQRDGSDRRVVTLRRFLPASGARKGQVGLSGSVCPAAGLWPGGVWVRRRRVRCRRPIRCGGLRRSRRGWLRRERRRASAGRGSRRRCGRR